MICVLKIQQPRLAKIFKNALSHINTLAVTSLYSLSSTWEILDAGSLPGATETVLAEERQAPRWAIAARIAHTNTHTHTRKSASGKNFKFLERGAWRIFQPCDACHGWGKPEEVGLESVLMAKPHNIKPSVPTQVVMRHDSFTTTLPMELVWSACLLLLWVVIWTAVGKSSNMISSFFKHLLNFLCHALPLSFPWLWFH